MVLFGAGRTFKRWVLVERSEGTWGKPLNRKLGSQPLFSCSLLPGCQKVNISALPHRLPCHDSLSWYRSVAMRPSEYRLKPPYKLSQVFCHSSGKTDLTQTHWNKFSENRQLSDTMVSLKTSLQNLNVTQLLSFSENSPLFVRTHYNVHCTGL
jgi:hypothetical protein